MPGIAAGLEIVTARRLGNRDDALDATQEAIARLLVCVREGKIGCVAELAPVAYGIAKHVIADFLRVRARDVVDADGLTTTLPNALDTLVSAEERHAVIAALALLSPNDRALLKRCFLEGQAIGRIAHELGEPAERVRKRKSRALQRLGAVLRRSAIRPVTNDVAVR